MKILLLSAYDTDSHHQWCQGLMTHLAEFEWQYLTLPGRYFSWRVRGNPLSWGFGPERAQLQKNYDLIVATSMVDLSTIKGLFPHLANTPSVYYFHENQFAYPKSQQQHSSIEPQMVTLYAALSAQAIWFNSQYNLETFLAGVQGLMKQMPDHAPQHLVNWLKERSRVMPVPITLPAQGVAARSRKDITEPLKVIWNHRWEYDKGPDTLADIIDACQAKELPVQFIVAGKRFRQAPERFEALLSKPSKNLIHIGTFEEKADYHQALMDSHVVLSTALHEFQGLAMLEGAGCGCVPLAPNHLAYPEWIPETMRYDVSNPVTDCVDKLAAWCQHGLPEVPNVRRFEWASLSQDYEKSLIEVGDKRVTELC